MLSLEPPNMDLTLLKPLLIPLALIVPNFLKNPPPELESSFLGAEGTDSASALTLGLLADVTVEFMVMDTASRRRGDGERPA